MTAQQECEYLLRRGMSVLCIDSYSPSRKECDHIVKPECFGCIPHHSEQILNEHAISILERIANEEPECKMTLSDVVEFLWDDYCDSHGEPDVEIG